MKRIIAILLIVLIALCVVGCKDNESSDIYGPWHDAQRPGQRMETQPDLKAEHVRKNLAALRTAVFRRDRCCYQPADNIRSKEYGHQENTADQYDRFNGDVCCHNVRFRKYICQLRLMIWNS